MIKEITNNIISWAWYIIIVHSCSHYFGCEIVSIDVVINDSVQFLNVELEFSFANDDEKLKVDFRLEFDYIRNKCTMRDMSITELDSVQ